MELVVAEKPSVARDLARVLGVPRRGDWFENDQLAITWCIGHLVELEEPAAYDDAWKPWRFEVLPMLPRQFKLAASKHAKQQLRIVKELIKDKRFSAVINACDAGREGELIFRYVYQFARSKLPVRRLWISSLTDDAIRRGFGALRPGREFEPLADAARSRSEADWLVGMNATRAMTIRKRRGDDGVSSIGRVQTPTLALLVTREREIRAFVPRDYWEVHGTFRTSDGSVFEALWRHGKQPRIAQQELAAAIVERCPRDARVVELRAKTVREAPPQLFDLTSLQRTANRRFGWSAARTLELAQALYERHKVITYPRTDSRHLSADVAQELPGLFTALVALPELGGFAQRLVDQPPKPSRRVVDDSKVSDHHAIIPTGAIRSNLVGPQLDRDEARLFDLIVRRFLGAFYPDAEIAVTEAWIRAGTGEGAAPPFEAADRETFVEALPPPPDHYLARGRVRLVAGWQEVAGISDEAKRRDDRKDRDDEPTGSLPALVKGQPLAGAYEAQAKQTTPPPRHSEATLLAAMESAGKSIDDEALREAMKDVGLGTPATRAAIIETLLRRNYIARERTHLVPTDAGMDLISALAAANVSSLASAELTGSWEARLAKIARGQDSRDAFMADIETYVTSVIDALRGAALPSAPRPPLPPTSPPASASSPPRSASSSPSRDQSRASWSSGAEPRSPQSRRDNRVSPPRFSPGSGVLPRPSLDTFDAEAFSSVARAAGRGDGDPATELISGSGERSSSGRSRSNHPRAEARPAASKPTRGARRGSKTTARSKSSAARKPARAPVVLSCPRCKLGTLIDGQRGWGCDRWREGCRFVIWFETAGKRLTRSQLEALIVNGKTRKATFCDLRGREIEARLVLDPQSATGVQLETT